MEISLPPLTGYFLVRLLGTSAIECSVPVPIPRIYRPNDICRGLRSVILWIINS